MTSKTKLRLKNLTVNSFVVNSDKLVGGLKTFDCPVKTIASANLCNPNPQETMNNCASKSCKPSGY